MSLVVVNPQEQGPSQNCWAKFERYASKIMKQQDSNDLFVLTLQGIPSWTRPRRVRLARVPIYPIILPGTFLFLCTDLMRGRTVR